jgi:hypothetical protein
MGSPQPQPFHLCTQRVQPRLDFSVWLREKRALQRESALFDERTDLVEQPVHGAPLLLRGTRLLVRAEDSCVVADAVFEYLDRVEAGFRVEVHLAHLTEVADNRWKNLVSRPQPQGRLSMPIGAALRQLRVLASGARDR